MRGPRQEIVGSWVVLDPTGRDMLECMEVGVVVSVRWDDEDDGDSGGRPRPILTVRLNSDEDVVAATRIHAVLPVYSVRQLR